MSIRVSSGLYKGKKIYTSFKRGVRPTKSIVKEAIIEILKPLENKVILDLFAGYGTVGIEALSRHAQHVTFIEKDKSVTGFLRKNLNEIVTDSNYDIVNEDVMRFLDRNQKKYDIIFADPPYRKFVFDQLQPAIANCLNDGGVFCMETNKNSLLNFPDVKFRKYGQTKVIFWKKT